MEVDLTPNHLANEWWDNEGKQYQELIPGGHPKELSNGCVKNAPIGKNYCESAEETTVYTCEGDTTWNVCLENRGNYYRVRGIGYGRRQLYNTRVYGIEGARASVFSPLLSSVVVTRSWRLAEWPSITQRRTTASTTVMTGIHDTPNLGGDDSTDDIRSLRGG
eukprot:Lankesteria_metandrocarpae@DN5462_c1_g1_i16.p1